GSHTNAHRKPSAITRPGTAHGPQATRSRALRPAHVVRVTTYEIAAERMTPRVAAATETRIVSLTDVSTAVRPSASAQWRVVKSSQLRKPLSSMNEFRSSTTNGNAPNTTKNPIIAANGTQRHGPRSTGRARYPRPEIVVKARPFKSLHCTTMRLTVRNKRSTASTIA